MISMTETVKSLVENIVRLMIDEPSELKVDVTISTKSVLVQIKSAKEDIGKIIGKKGRTIDAIKVITTVIKNTQFLGDKRDVFIEIIEDEKSDFVARKYS